MDFTRLGPGIRPKMRDAMTEVRNYLFPPYGDVFYVSKRGASGDGKSWTNSFLTITEGIAALTDNDTLFIEAGNYDEAATIELSGVKNVRIFGIGTGMQWGEGSTNWRSVTSEDHLFDITGCQSVEIAGIGFVIPTSDKYAIKFTGLCYSTHIHDCCFTGDCGGGAEMSYAIHANGANGPDTYIHDCRFFIVKTIAIVMGHQRNVVMNNLFIVPDSGIGISIPAATTASYNVIADNHFLGGGTSDHGIYYTAWTANNALISNNKFAGFAKSVPDNVDNTETGFVWNYESDATAGGIAAVAPNPS